MSPRKRQRKHVGCAIDVTPGGKLRLRFRSKLPGVGIHRFGETTPLNDTAENRRSLERQATLIGAEIRAGRFDYLRWFPDGSKAVVFRMAAETEKRGTCSAEPASTIAQYFDSWIAWKAAEGVRKSRTRDYKQHFKSYIIPALGDTPLTDLSLPHVRDVQIELRSAASPRRR